MAEPIDWIRTVHRVSSFLRGLRGDETADADHELERVRGSQLTKSLETFARKQVGCEAPEPCDCVVCRADGRTPP